MIYFNLFATGMVLLICQSSSYPFQAAEYDDTDESAVVNLQGAIPYGRKHYILTSITSISLESTASVFIFSKMILTKDLKQKSPYMTP